MKDIVCVHIVWKNHICVLTVVNPGEWGQFNVEGREDENLKETLSFLFYKGSQY